MSGGIRNTSPCYGVHVQHPGIRPASPEVKGIRSLKSEGLGGFVFGGWGLAGVGAWLGLGRSCGGFLRCALAEYRLRSLIVTPSHFLPPTAMVPQLLPHFLLLNQLN